MSAAAAPTEAQRAAQSLRHPLTLALLALTFSTGLVDAASYLGLGRVFAANMTGNVVLLGFGVAGSRGLPVLSPLVSLLAFLTGAGASGILTEARGHEPREHLRLVLALEAALLLVALALSLPLAVRTGSAAGNAMIALLALAMGLRNAAVRRIAVPDLTTTVLTLTVTALASELASGRSSRAATGRRAAAVATMLAGAVAGALLLKQSLSLVLAGAAALALFALCAYLRAA